MAFPPLPPRPALMLVVIIAAALTAFACGDSSDERIRSLDEILAGDIVVTDLTTSSAAVQLSTTIPVVCSVVYGIDQQYGDQSTDLDMVGRAHSDHRPRLRGLEPDTTYHYRLQGTASDGTFYVSQDLTFTTPPADPDDALGSAAQADNLAALAAGAQVIDASSTFGSSDTWRPENALDGDPNTEWSSASDGDAAFIEIALARTSQITAVGIWTRTMGMSAQITEFRVVTADGVILGPFTLPNANQLHLFQVEARARFLRFEVVASSGGNTGVVELAVIGAPAETPAE